MRLTGRDGGNFFGSHCGWSDKVLGVRSQTHFMRSINANANVHLLLCLYLKISLELTHILSHNTLTQIYDGLKLNYDGFYECFMSDRLDVSVTLLSWCNFWGNLGHTVLTKINISLKKILSWLCCLISTYYSQKEQPMKGSGCGSVGRAVASDTRGLQFESSHRRNFYWTLFTVNCVLKRRK